MIIPFIAASLGASLSMEQVTLGSGKIFWYLLLTAVFWIVAVLQVLQAFGYTATAFLLAIPTILIVGQFSKRLIQLSMIYAGLLSPEDV